MYKKAKPRSVMGLLNKSLGEREVAAIPGCPRNTAPEIKGLCRQQGMTWDDIPDMADGGLYGTLYPKEFKRATNYVPVDYAYVHSGTQENWSGYETAVGRVSGQMRERGQGILCVSYIYCQLLQIHWREELYQPYTAQAGSRGRGGLVWSYNVICGRGYRRNHNRISVCRHTAIQPVWVCGSNHGYERKGVA